MRNKTKDIYCNIVTLRMVILILLFLQIDEYKVAF